MRIKLNLNQDLLKIVAAFSMCIDHISSRLFIPANEIGRTFGRMAFPIFGYLLIYHLYQKKCFDKYIYRLLFFGIISEVVLWISDKSYNNVLFTFLLPVLCLKFMDWINAHISNKIGRVIANTGVFLSLLFPAFYTDYQITGFCFLMSLYGYFKFKTPLFLILTVLTCLMLNEPITWMIVAGTTLSVLLISNLNKNDRRYIHDKYFFYLFYPLHLFLLYLLKSAGVVF